MGETFQKAQPRSAARPTIGLAPDRPAPMRRFFTASNPVGRGLVLLVALIVFTLGYAYLLQYLSESSDRPAEPPAAMLQRPVVAPQAPAPALAFRAAPAAPRIASEPAAASYRIVDDSLPAANGERFTYLGQWDHATNINDGRSGGTSSRSYHIGATAAFQFSGTRLNVYGVRGPNGGYAELRIDGQTYGLLHFYAPRKEAGVLVYASPALPSGTHDVDIVVAQAPDGLPKRRFVNIDGASYAGK